MQIREVMSNNVQVINSGKSVQEAAALMESINCGALPVEENDKMVGMITDRDIAMRVVAQKKDPEKTTIKDCMSSGIQYCFDEDSVDEVSQKMKQEQHRRIPVVNKDKRLVGIVSLGDLALNANKDLSADTLQGVSRN